MMDSREMRLFACDCAERVLALYEEGHPDDGRPRRAVEVARKFAEGDAFLGELGWTHACCTVALVCRRTEEAKWALRAARACCLFDAGKAAGDASYYARVAQSIAAWAAPSPAWDAEYRWQEERRANLPA